MNTTTPVTHQYPMDTKHMPYQQQYQQQNQWVHQQQQSALEPPKALNCISARAAIIAINLYTLVGAITTLVQSLKNMSSLAGSIFSIILCIITIALVWQNRASVGFTFVIVIKVIFVILLGLATVLIITWTIMFSASPSRTTAAKEIKDENGNPIDEKLVVPLMALASVLFSIALILNIWEITLLYRYSKYLRQVRQVGYYRG